MRKAFSMITAVFMMMMMASISVVVFDTAGKVTESTTGQYRQEQSMLLAKSYTEFAVLAIQENNMSNGTGCLKTITADIDSLNGLANSGGLGRGEGYQIEIDISYIGLSPAITCTLGHFLGATTTPNSVSALIDVYVRYHDLSVVDALAGTASSSDPWVTYHRRTLQKL